jgi:hypothetical protein
LALRDQLAGVPVLGLPRKTERANDFHRTWRENLRTACNFADPLLTLMEEPDGQGLDCLVCRTDPEMPFAVRWGLYNGQTIQRNPTGRTNEVYEQGIMHFAEDDLNPREMPVVSLGFTLEDDYTEVGVPQWWFGKLVLLRERRNFCEFITDVHVYQKPTDARGGEAHLPAPFVAERQKEVAELEQMVARIRRGSA